MQLWTPPTKQEGNTHIPALSVYPETQHSGISCTAFPYYPFPPPLPHFFLPIFITPLSPFTYLPFSIIIIIFIIIYIFIHFSSYSSSFISHHHYFSTSLIIFYLSFFPFIHLHSFIISIYFIFYFTLLYFTPFYFISLYFILFHSILFYFIPSPYTFILFFYILYTFYSIIF